MKISIIIPVYRVAATLDRCVNSVVSQGIDDYELILVDDGSPDECPQLCDAWAARNSRVVTIHQKNGGLSAARNAGILKARGEYITFVDSDDYLAPQTYTALLQQLAGHPDVDMLEYPVCWHCGAPDERTLQFGDCVYTDFDSYWLQGQAYTHTYAWNKIYKRGLFTGIAYPEGEVFEDVTMLPQLLQRAKKVATTSQGLYCYCLNKEGITEKAGGMELRMLLNAHMRVMGEREYLLHNADYYMHVLNIQMDVAELAGDEPQLPTLRVNPLAQGLTFKYRIKAIALWALGIKGICKINKIIHRLMRSRL